MTPSVLITELCPYCAKGRSLADLRPWGGTRICTDCHQGHLAALNTLSTGMPPKECSECHTSYERLCERAGVLPGQPASMDCHNENGVYRLMCRKCSRKYVRQRKELYGPTEFGHKLGIS